MESIQDIISRVIRAINKFGPDARSEWCVHNIGDPIAEVQADCGECEGCVAYERMRADVAIVEDWLKETTP